MKLENQAVKYLYPFHTNEKLRFSDVFRGHRKRQLAWNWVSISKNIEEVGKVKSSSYNKRTHVSKQLVSHADKVTEILQTYTLVIMSSVLV